MSEFEILKDELENLLAQERAALVTGKTENLGRLIALKARLIDDFGRCANEAQLRDMQAKILRNSVLFDRSLAGLSAAAERIAAVRQAQTRLQTYDSFGNKQTYIAKSETSLVKRA